MKIVDKMQIADYLDGTYFTAVDTARLFDLDVFTGPDEVEEAANEYGIFCCDSCGYWTKGEELTFGICDSCIERPLNDF